ncbi:MAG: ATP-binding protein [Deltaproteobacteria bacterium]|nr:ATP-binding protein [Deltaproteobacteria bacterium]
MTQTLSPANPFLFGKPVGGVNFCNRSTELATLRELYMSANSAWLYSPRRYGKTSLIKESFAQLDAPNIHTAYVDFLPISAGQDVAEVYMRGISPLVNTLFGNLTQALKELKQLATSFVPALTVDEDGKPVLTMTGHARVGDASPVLEDVLQLPEKLAQKRKQRVVVAIDEFQEVASIRGLEARLRSVMQHQQHVSYIMAGSRASLLKTIFTSPERPFYQFAHHIPIDKIDIQELVRYICGRFEYTHVDIADEHARQIVLLADCHPHFVQYFASIAWQIAKNGALDEELIPLLTEQVVTSMDPGFRMFYDDLAMSQRRILAHIAVNGGEEMLSERVRAGSRLGSAATVQTALAALEKKESLVRQNNEWKYINPAFALWVRHQIVYAM